MPPEAAEDVQHARDALIKTSAMLRRDQNTGTEDQTVRCYSVPRYRFTVRDTDRFDEEDGVILPDDAAAREYAIQIMDELQKDDEAVWIAYTLEVIREGRVVWRIPFDRPSLPT